MIVGCCLFVSFIIMISLGVPVSISMGASSALGLIVGKYPIQSLPLHVTAGNQSFILLAIPFFVIAGNIMNKGGITKRIFKFASEAVGWIPGGLAQVNVMASVIFAGISGTAVGDQAGLGLIEMQAMKGAGYDEKFSAGITLASSVIGSIIPPSVPFILYSYLSGASTAKLFAGGLFPGFVIAAILMIHCYLVAVTGRVQCPPRKRFDFEGLVQSFINGIFAIMAPIIILWGMFSGVVTPTETGILAAAYCSIVAICYGELNIGTLKEILVDSALTSSLIMFLVGVGTIMGWLVSIERLPLLLSRGLLNITVNKYILLLLINVIIIALGCIMEAIPITMFLVPIVVPILNAVGIDLVHFGVIMTLGLNASMLTPPVGLGLYVMTSISNLSFEEIVQAVFPFYLALLIALLIITYIPLITLWLPNTLFG
jgi:tripartite ATP-independent transporter DctM subunit